MDLDQTDDYIQCDNCDEWFNVTDTNINRNEFMKYMNNTLAIWICDNCNKYKCNICDKVFKNHYALNGHKNGSCGRHQKIR